MWLQQKAADGSFPAVNVAAVVTKTAVAGQRHAIYGILFSYNAAPTGGRLTVTDGGVTVIDLQVNAAGAVLIPFNYQMAFGVNSEVVVTLAAGGAAVTGKLQLIGHTSLS